jgi:hypothetical protein
VINDGLKSDQGYQSLISKCSTDIVSKAKSSSVVAEQLAKLEKKLHKQNVTRWNSSLTMGLSVLGLTEADFKRIRAAMNGKSAKEQEAKRKFALSPRERDMLTELVELLKKFEFWTDELQTNDVSISRVLPMVVSLRTITNNINN